MPNDRPRRYNEIVQQEADLRREADEIVNVKLVAADLTPEARTALLEREEQISGPAGLLAGLTREKAAFERQFARERATPAPAVLRSGIRGDSKMLSVANIWRGVMAGGQGNAVAMNTYAAEEVAMSDRLLAAGYRTDHIGSMLVPLSADLLMAPVDKEGQPLADISGLKAELRERLALNVDPGELGWTLKRSPQTAALLGIQAADMQLGDDTLGGYLIPPTQSTTVFDLFRARSTVTRAGATMVPLPPSGNVTYPRLKSDPDFTWSDPDSTTDATAATLGLGVVRMFAKSLRGYVTMPNDLIRYSNPSVEMLVRAALAARAAVAFDSAALQGAGTSLEPKGLINYDKSVAETPAVGKITLHVAGPGGESSGDTFIPEDVMKIKGLYYQGDDPDEPTGWIMRPMMWAGIANLRGDAATAGDKKGPFMFWTSRGNMGAAIPEALGNVPVHTSSKVSKTRVESVSTLTYVLFGNFARLLLGMSGALELAVSEHVKFLQDKTVIRAVLRGDTGVSHEASFVMTDTLIEP